jgi:hypothetical protein
VVGACGRLQHGGRPPLTPNPAQTRQKRPVGIAARVSIRNQAGLRSGESGVGCIRSDENGRAGAGFDRKHEIPYERLPGSQQNGVARLGGIERELEIGEAAAGRAHGERTR